MQSVLCLGIFIFAMMQSANAQSSTIILRPAAVFDGQDLHTGWSVVVTGDKIAAVESNAKISVPTNARTIDLPNETLLPGMIEGHSHFFLHPYNETSWNDQVTNESFAFRTARATAHCAENLAGWVHNNSRSRDRRRGLR